MKKSVIFLFLFLISINLQCRDAMSHALRFGLGGSYNQIELPNALGVSIFNGFGFVGDIRFKYAPVKYTSSKAEYPLLSFDLFGLYRQETATNLAGSVKEVARRKFQGLGVDFCFWRFSLGMQGGTSTLNVGLGSTSLASSFTTYGGRAAFQFDLNEAGSLGLFILGIAEFGNYELGTIGSKQMNEYSAIAMLNYNLLEIFNPKPRSKSSI